MDSVMVDRAINDHMFALLAFDYAETVARIRTVSDAQKLIDLIDLPVRSRCSVQGCSPGIRNFCKGTTPSAVPLFEQTWSLYSELHMVSIRGEYMHTLCTVDHVHAQDSWSASLRSLAEF
ncbi:hypothetical protein M378DRAFT_820090 [Amanita muscaria Koide BX008]|uniref:Uncharacterized protein n=1 Tax=Amanita muscaria (strain Koide BX008) TaxID=946122 RepID=A0A0C2WZ93_AMAMK|nr:hypothetical protein M378DRAFT_820090 [Amanita muscaria Koide BX008]